MTRLNYKADSSVEEEEEAKHKADTQRAAERQHGFCALGPGSCCQWGDSVAVEENNPFFPAEKKGVHLLCLIISNIALLPTPWQTPYLTTLHPYSSVPWDTQMLPPSVSRSTEPSICFSSCLDTFFLLPASRLCHEHLSLCLLRAAAPKLFPVATLSSASVAVM